MADRLTAVCWRCGKPATHEFHEGNLTRYCCRTHFWELARQALELSAAPPGPPTSQLEQELHRFITAVSQGWQQTGGGAWRIATPRHGPHLREALVPPRPAGAGWEWAVRTRPTPENEWTPFGGEAPDVHDVMRTAERVLEEHRQRVSRSCVSQEGATAGAGARPRKSVHQDSHPGERLATGGAPILVHLVQANDERHGKDDDGNDVPRDPAKKVDHDHEQRSGKPDDTSSVPALCAARHLVTNVVRWMAIESTSRQRLVGVGKEDASLPRLVRGYGLRHVCLSTAVNAARRRSAHVHHVRAPPSLSGAQPQAAGAVVAAPGAACPPR